MAQKANSLAHTKWMCKYHIVFCPKYRRKAIYNQYREDLGQILRQLCQRKGVEIIEGHLMPDHVHMPAGIPPKTGVSSFMGHEGERARSSCSTGTQTSGTSSGTGGFWAEGHYVPTVGLSEATIAKYIREQEQADIAPDQPGVKEYEDPFKK